MPFLRHFGDDRRGAGTGAATHAGGDEDHVGAFQHFGNALAIFQSRLTTDFRIGAGTQPLGDARAELQNGARRDVLQRLCVGVGADELDALDVVLGHVIDGVAATTTYTDHFYDGGLCDVIDQFKHFPSPSFLVLSPTVTALNQKLPWTQRLSRSRTGALGSSLL